MVSSLRAFGGVPMPSQEDIDVQQELLATHRRNLSNYLRQQARIGVDYVPPAILNGIQDARDNIRRIKKVLRGWNIRVEDHPNDEAFTHRLEYPNSPLRIPGTSSPVNRSTQAARGSQKTFNVRNIILISFVPILLAIIIFSNLLYRSANSALNRPTAKVINTAQATSVRVRPTAPLPAPTAYINPTATPVVPELSLPEALKKAYGTDNIQYNKVEGEYYAYWVPSQDYGAKYFSRTNDQIVISQKLYLRTLILMEGRKSRLFWPQAFHQASTTNATFVCQLLTAFCSQQQKEHGVPPLSSTG